jgi:IS1 family transposase
LHHFQDAVVLFQKCLEGFSSLPWNARSDYGGRSHRAPFDEAWSFVAKKQKNLQRHEIHAKGDQCIFIAMAGMQKAIISWGVGKRNTESTMDFLHDLCGRVIDQPKISTDGFHTYRMAIRDAFGESASHGVIVKTYSVTHLVKEA